MNRDNLSNVDGVNSANNLFDSSLVTPNRDGSKLERLEDLAANALRNVSKALTTTANGSTTLFNFTGAIRINSIIGVVTTIMENKQQNMKLAITPDGLAAYDICANKDIDTFAVGSLLSITGTAANAMVSTTAVGTLAPSQAGGVLAACITSGIIKVVSGAANTGAITWHLNYTPLSADAVVTAA
jgi:hypothetical protein